MPLKDDELKLEEDCGIWDGDKLVLKAISIKEESAVRRGATMAIQPKEGKQKKKKIRTLDSDSPSSFGSDRSLSAPKRDPKKFKNLISKI